MYCGVVGAVVEDATDKGVDRAGNGVAAAAVGEGFAADSVFWVSMVREAWGRGQGGPVG